MFVGKLFVGGPRQGGSEALPICDRAVQLRAERLASTDRAARLCLECFASTDCADSALPVCDEVSRSWVECVHHTDCTDDKPFCADTTSEEPEPDSSQCGLVAPNDAVCVEAPGASGLPPVFRCTTVFWGQPNIRAVGSASLACRKSLSA